MVVEKVAPRIESVNAHHQVDHTPLFVRENRHCLNQGADQWKNQQRRENRPYVNLDKNQQRRENHLENLHVDQEYDLKRVVK